MKIGFYSVKEILAEYDVKRCVHNLIVSGLALFVSVFLFFVCVVGFPEIVDESEFLSRELAASYMVFGVLLNYFGEFLADFYRLCKVAKRDLSSTED